MLQIISSDDENVPRALDAFDRRILDILQRDASLSLAEISSRVGLSQTPCWRRIQRLERSGIIQKRIAVLDPARVGLSVAAYVFVKVSSHDQEMTRQFMAAAKERSEIVGASRVTGDSDFLLQIAVKDIAAYDRFYREFISSYAVESVSAQFVLDSFKQHGPLDLTEV